MISYRFAPISSQKGVLFFETPGIWPILEAIYNINLSVVWLFVLFSICFEWACQDF